VSAGSRLKSLSYSLLSVRILPQISPQESKAQPTLACASLTKTSRRRQGHETHGCLLLLLAEFSRKTVWRLHEESKVNIARTVTVTSRSLCDGHQSRHLFLAPALPRRPNVILSGDKDLIKSRPARSSFIGLSNFLLSYPVNGTFAFAVFFH
jgi:hypothetical protein